MVVGPIPFWQAWILVNRLMVFQDYQITQLALSHPAPLP
jgi:hypothetical protein